MIIEELEKPLRPEAIKTRKQGNVNLSYIEGHHVIREANRIFGFCGWERTTNQMNMVQCEQITSTDNYGKEKTLWYVSYTCKATVTVMSIERDGVGFGQGQDKDLGKAHESAIKEAETDAMKRALMTFGDPFGLALYDKEQTHVAKEPVEPAKAKSQVSPHLKAAGAFVQELGLMPADFQKFKAACALVGIDWVNTALAAKEDGVKTLDDLMKKTEKEPLEGEKLTDRVKEIFGA